MERRDGYGGKPTRSWYDVVAPFCWGLWTAGMVGWYWTEERALAVWPTLALCALVFSRELFWWGKRRRAAVKKRQQQS